VEAQDIVLVLVVVTALAFDFTNGFHDTANAMATSIATRTLKPKVAAGVAALLNFVGAFISLKVASTIAEDIVDPKAITTTIIRAGLLGGIFWTLLTWRLSMPSSSSHALIGGVVRPRPGRARRAHAGVARRRAQAQRRAARRSRGAARGDQAGRPAGIRRARMQAAEDVAGIEAKRMTRGTVSVTQESEHATRVTGAKIDEIG
jgi:Phosphate transporter family